MQRIIMSDVAVVLPRQPVESGTNREDGGRFDTDARPLFTPVGHRKGSD